MDISIKARGRHLIVSLVGQLDIYNTGEVRSQIISAFTPDMSGLVLDLKLMSYMDSAGIGLLAQLARKYGGNDRTRFCLMGVRDEVMTILRMTGMDIFFAFVRGELDLDTWASNV